VEKCEVNANDIRKLEERVNKLEQYRETDKSQINELDKSLGIFINEMKNISNDLKTIVSNFKEAITRSTNAQEKEVERLKEKVVEQDKKIEKLNTKLENETIVANSDKWKKISSYVLTAILGAIITFLFTVLGLK